MLAAVERRVNGKLYDVAAAAVVIQGCNACALMYNPLQLVYDKGVLGQVAPDCTLCVHLKTFAVACRLNTVRHGNECGGVLLCGNDAPL